MPPLRTLVVASLLLWLHACVPLTPPTDAGTTANGDAGTDEVDTDAGPPTACGFADCESLENGTLEACELGASLNRVGDATCPGRPAPPEPDTSEPDWSYVGCKSHSECGDGEYCVPTGSGFGDTVGHTCVRLCDSDADCGTGEACLCGSRAGLINECVPAECRTSTDCDGLPCGVTQVCCGSVLRCRDAVDACGGNCGTCGHACGVNVETCDVSGWVTREDECFCP